MKKVFMLDHLNKLLAESPTTEELSSRFEEDVKRFENLTDILMKNWVDEEVLLVPMSEWAWYQNKLGSHNQSSDEFWSFVKGEEAQKEFYQKIAYQIIQIPPVKEGNLYV